jgi:hypothetical protein
VWLIRWIIKNHPDIRLVGHLERGLSVSTADKTTYSEMRELWLSQVSRFPHNGVVLSNAANALALTDRETAMNWLKHARELDPLDWRIPRYLGNLYAAAIIGISILGRHNPLSRSSHMKKPDAMRRSQLQQRNSCIF